MSSMFWPIIWPLRAILGSHGQRPLFVEPSRLQLILYWLCACSARSVADVRIIPERLREQMILFLTQLSSFFLGHRTSLDSYIGCARLARAISVDDADEVLNMIRTYPASVEAPWMGTKPLDNAISSSALKSAEILLDYGGLNPTNALKSCSSLESLRLLIKKGANIKDTDDEGRRCVDVVAMNGWIEVAEAMIKAGSYPSPTCLRILRNRGHEAIAARLTSLMTNIRLENQVFISLVLLRSSPYAYSSNLVRDLIFQFADVEHW